MNRTEFIQEYLNRGFSLIPLKDNGKEACIRWKTYQRQRAGLEDILSWYAKFPGANIGIITGRISKLIVLDVDYPSILPELFKRLPEAEKTTRVKTRRCYHFYFSHNGNRIRSINNFLNLDCELRAEGRLVVACPSVINDFTYRFIIPLSEIRPFPERITEGLEETLPEIGTGIKEGKQAPGGVEYRKKRVLSLPRYNGLDRYCMKQILDRELRPGERDNSLFILYNLLSQNKNRKDHSKKIVILKNNSLSRPLTDQELKKVFRKRYKLKCSKVREILPYIECSKCRFKFKGGRLGMGNIIVKNIMKIPELDTKEKAILLLLGTVFEGEEEPSIYQISKISKMDKRIVQKAIRGLREKKLIKKTWYPSLE